MVLKSRFLLCVSLSAAVCCTDGPAEPVIAEFSRDDLIGYWQGSLSRWVINKDTSQTVGVSGFVRARSGYVEQFDFSDSRVDLRLERNYYAMAIYFREDTILAEYTEWGKWLWDPNSPADLQFDSSMVEIYVDVVSPLGVNSYKERKTDHPWNCSLEYNEPVLISSGFKEATLKLDRIVGKAAFSEFNLEKLPTL
ncbi:MAG: hypothetical protein V1794_01910 [Candidatus Glassbacteria bacterium]